MTEKSPDLIHPTRGVGLRGLRAHPVLAAGEDVDAGLKTEVKVETMGEAGRCFQAFITNTGTRGVRIQGIRWTPDPTAGQAGLLFPPALRPTLYCTENLRGDWFGIGTTEGDRYGHPLTNQPLILGESEDHQFPGLFIGAERASIGLLLAQTGQRRLQPVFRLRGHIMDQNRWLVEIEERAVGIAGILLQPGETLAGEPCLVQIVDTNDPQEAMAGYYAILRRQGAFARREQNPLPKQRIYCSWNYDFFGDIDEEKMLGQIPVLKRHFPSVRFLQIDDGYQACHGPDRHAMIDLCYGDLPQPFDPKRFPDGPKAFCDKVRAAGYRPAIWLGLWASLGSRIIQDHPDWILRTDTGEELKFTDWYGGTAILDPSVPGVRDYLDHVAATVFGDWGFEGLKLDFSTFAVNGKRVRYREAGWTAVEWRHEIEAIFRRHLPADGFFGWCVVAGTAQPFLSQADYFRCAIDIGHGDWNLARRIALWTANTNLFLQERPCLPNIDSIGWSAAFDETSWRTWLNLVAVSGAGLEVSGDLRKLPEERLRLLARTLELSDPDRRVWCPDLVALAPGQPPSLWRAEGRDGLLLGAFNWNDTNAVFETHDLLCGTDPASLRDAWTGESVAAAGPVALKPRESRLWLARQGKAPSGGTRQSMR
jgi:hypothetical protein